MSKMTHNSYYLRLTRIPKITMIIAGVYPLECRDSTFLQMCYDSVSYIILGLYYCIISFHIFICVPAVMKQEKIHVVAISISHALSISITAVKATVSVTKRMRNLIMQCFSKHQKSYDIQFDQELMEQFKKNSIFFNAMFSLLVSFIIFSLISLWTISVHFYHKTLHLDENSKDTYVMADLFPFLNYPTVGLIYKMVAIVIMGLYRALVALYFLAPTMYITGQLKALQVLTRTLGETKNAMRQIKNIIRWHQDIIKFNEELNKLLSFTLLLEYVVTTITLAALMLVDLLPDSTGLVLAFSAQIFVVYTSQLFLMAWQTTDIVDQSLAISDSLAESSWYEQSKELKQIIHIMIMRTQRPLTIRVGKFFPMTLKTALSSIKLAYSYATMALTMELS